MFEEAEEPYPQKSTITFLPMIDLNPSDVTCIFTTLMFVSEQPQRYGKTPVLTFDQPLYQKAMDIICLQNSSNPLHALTSCDTTSRMFGVSKVSTIKTFKTNPAFRKASMDFLNSSSQTDIKKYGEHLIVTMYGGSPSDKLDKLRYQKFSTKVIAGTASVQVQTLPPTSVAVSFHCFRVFYQTYVWMGNTSLNPLEYGWQIIQNMMRQVKTSLPPAPENLMKTIRCNCKVNCDSKKCTCRKHGLDCSSACGDCKGVSCSNSLGLSDLEALVDDEA